MTDPLSRLKEIRAREQAATAGPWWYDEDERVWRLHGIAFRIPAHDPIPEQIINYQILKAPKRGTSYAEYWPNKEDGEFIVSSRTDIPRLLEAVEGVIRLHKEDHLSENPHCEECGERWPCPTIKAIIAGLND